MKSASLRLVNASDIETAPPPQCDACGKAMWWHGGTMGWGCPVPGGDPNCRSSLYRPRPPEMRGAWPHHERYPELGA